MSTYAEGFETECDPRLAGVEIRRADDGTIRIAYGWDPDPGARRAMLLRGLGLARLARS